MTLRFLDDIERPLDDLAVTSDHVQLAQSSALHQGAENLLLKALDARADQPDRAAALVRRALRLPFDEYEQCTPAWWQAYFMLFMSVTDELEENPDDQTWLDAVLRVEQEAEGHGRRAVRLVLAVIEQDYELGRAEARRIRERVGQPRPLPEWQDELPAHEDDAVAAILQVLAAFDAYDDALAEA